MFTFRASNAIDYRAGRALPGRPATVVDAETGEPVDTYSLAGQQTPLVSNSRGWLAPFRADARTVEIRIEGGDPIPLVAVEVEAQAAELEQVINRGRLSEEELKGAIATEVIEQAGTVPIFGSQAEAQAWEADHPGRAALWFDAGYTEVVASGPTWADEPLLGGGTWTTPTEPGVIYQPASGTAGPGETVTVTATAKPGYAIVGVKSWTHTFPMSTDTLLTDFTDDPLGDAPTNWTPRWVVPSEMGWTVVEHGAGTGGKVLEHRATTNERRALAWDPIQTLDATDVEVVFKWRTSTATSPPRAVVRGTGTAGSEAGYHGAVRNASEQAMGVLNGGTSAFLPGGQPISIATNTWYITRFRIEGNQLMAKTWLADEPEPADWTLTATDSTHTAEGFVGLYCFGAGVILFDWYGAAVGGATAPKGD